MADKINFTKRALDELPSADKYYQVFDAKVNGLALRVMPSSKKSFYFFKWLKSTGRPSVIRIGTYPDVTIEQARRKAQELGGLTALGRDPAAEAKELRNRMVTLEEVFKAYLEARSDLKPRTVRDYAIVRDKYLGDWQKLFMAQITKDKIAARHKHLAQEHGEAQANMAMRVLRALFNFAAGQYEDSNGQSLFPDNPVKRLSHTRAWYRVDRRRTLIKTNQLKPWFAAVLALQSERSNHQAEAIRDYLLFLLLTGLRKEEAARLRWADVDLDNRTFAIPDTKNREPHTLPLSDFLLALLAERKATASSSPFVFQGDGRTGYIVEPRKQMAKVTAASGVEFMLHDLRRTFVTVAESLDIPAYALKRLLNHKSSADVTAGYIVIDVERLREPMQRITDFILKAAGLLPTADVRPIKKAGQ